MKEKTKNKRKIRKKKGFTLIELLAVIIILGLLMAIAIPSITRYIEASRKKAYIQTLSSYADSVSKMIANGDIGGMTDPNTVYYIPNKCIDIEKGGTTSPNGEWEFAYILISSNNGNNKYYAYTKDVKSFGVEGIEISKLKTSDVKITQITKDNPIAIDGKNTVSIVPDSCDFNAQTKKVVGAMQPADSCFEINASGTITKWNAGKTFNPETGSTIIDKNNSCYTSNLVIPSTINGITVTTISDQVFKQYELTSVIIPTTVTTIYYEAFSLNNLTNINIPINVTRIYHLAFGWNKLTSVKINNPNSIVDNMAFCNNPINVANIIGAPSTFKHKPECFIAW